MAPVAVLINAILPAPRKMGSLKVTIKLLETATLDEPPTGEYETANGPVVSA